MTISERDWKEKGPILVERLLDARQCAEIVSTFERGTPRKRTYQGLIDLEQRDCQFVELPPSFEVFLCDRLVPVMTDFFGVAIENRFTHAPLLFRYLRGAGFIPHHDMVTPIEEERGRINGQPVIRGDFSVLLFPSDPQEYVGGELYFPNHGCIFKPEVGSVVAFPASEKFIHGVKPIRDGIRYSVLCRMDAAPSPPKA